MAKAMAKLQRTDDRAHHLGDHAERARAVGQRVLQAFALLQQFIRPRQLLGTLTQALHGLGQRIGERIGLFGDARRDQPAAAPQAEQQEHEEHRHGQLVGQRRLAAEPAAHAVDQHTEKNRGEQQQDEIERQPGDDAHQHHDGQHRGLHNRAIGGRLGIVLRCRRGHDAPPREYKRYDRPRRALIQLLPPISAAAARARRRRQPCSRRPPGRPRRRSRSARPGCASVTRRPRRARHRRSSSAKSTPE